MNASAKQDGVNTQASTSPDPSSTDGANTATQGSNAYEQNSTQPISSSDTDTGIASTPEMPEKDESLKQEPEVVEKETIVVKEKKVGRKGCLTFSFRSFCCWGCLLLILLVGGSLAFLYMVFFSEIGFFSNMRQSVANSLDQWFTGELPTYQTVDTELIRGSIGNLDVDTNPTLTLEMTEDEFNSYIAENMADALASDTGTDIQKIKILIDFSSSKAEVFIKVEEPALPTVITYFSNDEKGRLKIVSAETLRISLNEDSLKNVVQGESDTVLTPNFLFETVLLADKSDQFTAKEIYFGDNKIKIVFGVRGE